MWPTDPQNLAEVQFDLAANVGLAWESDPTGMRVGGVWACFPRGLAGPGSAGDPAWVSAVVMDGRQVVDVHTVVGAAGAAYVPGMLALRIGALLEECVRGLGTPPDVLLLDATGRDHPRRAGLALHLGAVLDLPTVGVTHRPLVGTGPWPAETRGATSPVRADGLVVGCWLRTRSGTRPVVVHPGWRVELDTAAAVVLAATHPRRRTPEPLRQARQRARRLRATQTRVGKGET
jgi:deoxyribonuclease V